MKQVRVISLILIIIFFRWLFLHESVRNIMDEDYYKDSLLALNYFLAHQFKDGVICLFNSSRPGYNIISFIPAGLQGLLYKIFQIDPRNPVSLLIPQIANVIPAFYTLYFFYKILSLYINDIWVSMIALICLALTINNTIYTTNLLPYDYSLAIILGILYSILNILSNNIVVTQRYFFSIGVLSALSVAVYPGYYLVIPLFYILPLFFLKQVSFYKRILNCIMMTVGVTIPIIALQLLSMFAGISYIAKAANLSKTIVQGSFEEGYVFFLKYMRDVEQYFGIIWLVGTCIFMIILFMNIVKKNDLTKKYLYISVIVSFFLIEYFYYAYNSYQLHKMVFYGRLLHLFFPVIILATFTMINTIPQKMKRILASMLLIGAITNIGFFYAKASTVAFPLSLINKYKINTNKSISYFSSDVYFPYITYDSIRNNESYTLLNMGIYTYPKAYTEIQVPNRDTLAYKMHYQHLYAYEYEGMNIATRSFFQKHNIYIGVFK